MGKLPKTHFLVSQYSLIIVGSFTDRKSKLGKAAVLRFRKYALKGHGSHRTLLHGRGEFEDGIEIGRRPKMIFYIVCKADISTGDLRHNGRISTGMVEK